MIRPKLHDCDDPSGEVLLIAEVLVSGDQKIETFSLGAIEQISVLKAAPAHFDNRSNFVRSECVSAVEPEQIRREGYSSRGRLFNARLTIAQNSDRLRSLYRRKRFQKVVERESVGEILKQSADWHASASKNRSATEDLGINGD